MTPRPPERLVDGVVYVVVFDGAHRSCDADLLAAVAIPRKQRGDEPAALKVTRTGS